MSPSFDASATMPSAPRAERDFRAFGHQPQYRCAADAFGAAGHCRHFAF